MTEAAPVQWRALGGSVRGALHRRRGLPNQDAILWSPGSGSSVVLAVADGHGSRACFRSGTGSRLAVETATKLLRGLDERGDPDLPDAAAGWFPAEMSARWREAVCAHLAANPFTENEPPQRPGSRPFTAYGSTLLGVLATSTRMVYTQIGDGDILIVSEDGAVSRPWPRDARCLGVETTSLCGPAAPSDTRVLVQEVTAQTPALVLLATDGYANSFREDEGFLRIGSDILDFMRQDGVEKVERELAGWLNEASECGSGDDITVGVLYRLPALDPNHVG